MNGAPLAVLCAGAAKALVFAASERFALRDGGCRIEARFGPVGTMRDALAAGAPCDVLLVTESLARELAAGGVLDGATLRVVGSVPTAVAVRAGAAHPPVGSEGELRDALLAATAIHVPDLARSTAGQHVLRVLDRLGIRDRVAPKLHGHAGGGAAAMPALAADGDAALGIAQATEIAYSAGVEHVASLPEAFGLETVYAAAVTGVARDPRAGRRFVDFIAGPDCAARRTAAGFGAAEP